MPSLGKRVFSNNQDTSFHDYLRNKKGIEIIKNLKSSTTCNKVKFLSYNDFTMLSRTFSRNSNILSTNIENNRSIDDKTIGLIYHEKITSHIKECEMCKKNNGTDSLLLCSSIKSIMYAYENNLKNTSINIFQQGIDLDRWCKSCENTSFPMKDPVSNNYFEEEEEEEQPEIECNCPEFKVNKFGAGRNPIFCTQCNKFIDICGCANRWARKDEIKRINRKNITSTEFSKNKKALFLNNTQKKNI